MILSQSIQIILEYAEVFGIINTIIIHSEASFQTISEGERETNL